MKRVKMDLLPKAAPIGCTRTGAWWRWREANFTAGILPKNLICVPQSAQTFFLLILI